jgi:FkbM family methyltransferase
MEPTLVITPPANADTRNLLVRGWNTVVVERKLPYRIGRWTDSMCRSLGSRLRTVTADGLTFSVRRGTWADESILNHVIRDREYHPPGYEIGPADVVIDVGANIGTVAVSAARAARDGWVYAFEPEPDNFALLQRNLARNRCRNVTAVRAAVLDAPGRVTLRTNPHNSGGHSVRWQCDGPAVTVTAVALRQVFDDHRIERCDYLKLDCEGAEYDILRGLPPAYFARVRRLVMEYHAEPDEKRERGDELVALLRGVGFRIDQYTDVVGSRCGLVFASRPKNCRESPVDRPWYTESTDHPGEFRRWPPPPNRPPWK